MQLLSYLQEVKLQYVTFIFMYFHISVKTTTMLLQFNMKQIICESKKKKLSFLAISQFFQY